MTGRPIPGASVELESMSTTRVTSALGSFAFSDVPLGVNQFFPNLQAAYTSSRSYGGFATTPGRGEPLSYEEGHAVNSWLANHTSVGGVWQGWGAYLWAPSCTDDVMNGGGVCYFDHDFIAGGVFPSASGKGKISFLMHHRLLLERWYRR